MVEHATIFMRLMRTPAWALTRSMKTPDPIHLISTKPQPIFRVDLSLAPNTITVNLNLSIVINTAGSVENVIGGSGQ